MQRRTVIIVLAIIAVGAGGYFVFGSRGPTEPRGASQPTSEVRRLPEIVSASGTVVPLRWSLLSFPLGGKIERLAADMGDQVQSGVLLARLEASSLEQAVAQAEAALATAQRALAQVEAKPRPQEVAAAEAEVAAAAAGLAAAQAGRDQAQAALGAAEAGQEAAQANLKIAEAQLATADSGVTAAEAQLSLLRAGASDQQRNIAQLEIDQARNALWGAQAQRDSIGGYVDDGFAKQSELDAAEAAVGNAHVAMNIAEVAYAEVQAGPRAEEIAPLAAQVGAARASLESAQGQIEAAKATTREAGSQVSLAQAQLDAAEAQVSTAEARVSQAQAQLDLLKAGPRSEDVALAGARVTEAEAALQAAQSALAQAQLESPFAGTVARLAVREGEVVTSGQPIVHLGDLSALQVETTDLNEVDIAKVKVGQPVEITFDALPERLLTGRVESIEPISTPGQGGTNYRTVVSLDELDAGLRWGMTAFVDITVGGNGS